MAVLPIIVAPDRRLKVKCAPVETVDESIVRLMDDMLETMYLAPGIGLAAPQIGVTKRIIVVDTAGKDEEPNPYRMVNPELLGVSEETWLHEEGCLSLPEHYADVERPARISVRYLDEAGKKCEMEADGLLATCIQHEMDHLDGLLFVDHISALKRNMILRKLSKTKKLQEAAAAE
jgi:peptide deformylase